MKMNDAGAAAELRIRPCREVLSLKKRATHEAIKGTEFFAFRLSGWFMFVREVPDCSPRAGDQLSLF